MSEPNPFPPPDGLPDRYVDLGPIAVGGMGEVRRVHDRLLDRPLALKLMQPDNALNPWARRRFDEEGRVTAQLQHPGIVPVHDRGELPDGRPWYTMREIAGDTLGHVLSQGRWPRRRLMGVFEQICQVMAFAHANRVIHRDLKPDNVVVGPFGEVLVLDWGVARRLDQPQIELLDSESTLDRSLHTRDGTIVGTPAYMAPEQAIGDLDAHGPHTDVYAFGSMLYQALAGRTPYGGATAMEVWQRLMVGPPPDIATLCEVPDGLAALVRDCMVRVHDGRPTMGEVADRLRAWRDRDAARERAAERVREAHGLAREPAALRQEAEDLERRAQELLDALPRPTLPEAKVEAWALQDRAGERRVTAEIAEQRWLQVLHDALEHDADCVEAHRELADHWRERLAAAEVVGDRLAAARAEVELVRHDVGGRHAAWLKGDATLVLQTEPPGARATLYRMTTVARRRVPAEPLALGTTPLEVQVPPGSYQVVYELDGYHPATYLAAPGRSERWDLVPPGADAPEPTLLLPLGTLPDDVVYVPAGWFRSGGDPEAIDPTPAARIWVDAFVIQRAPVTFRHWLDYLDATGRFVPTSHVQPLARRTEAGWQATSAYDAMAIREDMPVFHVSAEAAEDYARWRSDRDGRPWALPHDLAWEKAARGADGRRFPWGDHFEESWATTTAAFVGKPHLMATDERPADVSPYGVRGLLGNVRDWCGNAYMRTPTRERVVPTASGDRSPFRMIRGGAFISTARNVFLASRHAAPPTQSFSVVGVRLAYTIVIGETATRTPAGQV